MDRDVGRIMDLLKELGIDEGTIVFFTSDNGPYQGSRIPIDFFDSNGRFRGGKRDLYEGGIRVPMIVRWPGRIAPGQTSDQAWAFWDFLPTAAELAGLPAPGGIDGVSVMPTLRGMRQKTHDYLYWDYGHVRGRYFQAVRWGNWKGIRNGLDTPIEIYDLKQDPEEAHDLAAGHPDVVKHIAEIMVEARSEHPDYPIALTRPVGSTNGDK